MTKYFFLIWLSWQLLGTNVLAASNELVINKVFSDIIQSKALVNHTNKTLQSVIDDEGCQFYCFLDDDCISYNFDEQQRICNLSDSDHIIHPEDLVDTPNAIYRRIENNCACTSNAIRCKIDFFDGTHRCECKAGFNGENCATDIDDCLHNPCQNGGSCNDKVNGYDCTCAQGFTGKNCETNIDDCLHNLCQNGGSCNDKVNGYDCACAQGFTGKNCETKIDHCKSNPCKNGGLCESNVTGYECACHQSFWGINCENQMKSCQDIWSKTSQRENMTYRLFIDNKTTDIYCHLTDDICGGGGWTLAMKIDGSKDNFRYNSVLWTNKKSYNPIAGQTGFDNNQTKMPSYWAMPFDKLCVGLKVNDTLKWTVIPYKASSLYDVIAKGEYRPTNISKAKWLSLIDGARLQENCNREGFNTGYEKSGYHRIGIISNEQNDCNSVDSFLGIGAKKKIHKHTIPFSCGNFCGHGKTCNGREISITAFGYIMIQ